MTEEQLREIKHQLEIAVKLIQEAITHKGKVSKVTKMTPAIAESLERLGEQSPYAQAPQQIWHWQNGEEALEVRKGKEAYYLCGYNYIPEGMNLYEPVKIGETKIEDTAHMRLLPMNVQRSLAVVGKYGRFPTLEKACEKFNELLRQKYTNETVVLERLKKENERLSLRQAAADLELF